MLTYSSNILVAPQKTSTTNYSEQFLKLFNDEALKDKFLEHRDPKSLTEICMNNYTEWELFCGIELLTRDMKDWRDSIVNVATHELDLDFCRAACLYYTGSVFFEIEPINKTSYRVSAAGYWANQ